MKGIKEQFARVFENPDRVNFRNLLKNLTGEYDELEFKEKEIEYPKLAKHILAMANTNGGIICYGVCETDNNLKPIGMTQIDDITDMKKKLNKYLPYELNYEIYTISYDDNVEWKELKNKSFILIIIEFEPEYIPFLPLNGSKYFEKTDIFCRKNSSSTKCEYDDLMNILNNRIETNVITTLADRDLAELHALHHYARLFPTIPIYKKLYKEKIGIIRKKMKWMQLFKIILKFN